MVKKGTERNLIRTDKPMLGVKNEEKSALIA
jgi:hypothetical protein